MRALAAKLTALLTPAERRRWLAIGPLLFLTGAIEMVGTGLVFLLVKIAGDPSTPHRVPFLRTIFHALPARWQSPDRAVLVYGVFLAIFFVGRSLALVAVTYAQNRAVADTVAGLSARTLGGYLAAPYALHLRHTSSELAFDATSAVERTVENGMGALAHVVAEILVSAGLALVLLFVAPTVTLVTGVVLALFVLTTLKLTKHGSRRWSREREQLARQAWKDVQENLSGIREIKILGREEAFTTSFAVGQRTLARIRRRHGTLMAVPRLAIETIFVSCVVLIVALATLRGDPRETIVPLLGLYAYAGFRLIPSANRLMLHVDALRLATPAIERLYAHRMEFEVAPAPAGDGAAGPVISFQDAIVLHHVSFRYGPSTAPVLMGIDATIRRGQSVGVVGATGAGKSTLIDLIFGLLEPTEGKITVDGVDIRGAGRAWQGRIGYVPQAAFLFGDTIRRNVALGIPAAEIDDGRLREALQLAQLTDFVASLPAGIETAIGERGIRLSGGQRQRVAIARALYHDPDLLVFDEATAALDNQTEREVTRAIEDLRGRKTVIVIAHRLSTVRRCDALLFLRAGRLQAVGSYDRLIEDNPDFRAMAAAPEPVVEPAPAVAD